MAVALTMLEMEERRRRRMSGGLLAALLVAGIAISNERALLFDAGPDFDQVEAAATIRALVARVTPTLWQAVDHGSPIIPIQHAREAATPPPVAFAARIPTDRILPAAVQAPMQGELAAPPPPDVPNFFTGSSSGGPIGPGPFVGGSGSSSGGTPGSSGDPSNPDNPPPTSAVPEPSAWAMMLVGFGAMGAVLRAGVHRRRTGARTA